jgi:hypothetical protein
MATDWTLSEVEAIVADYFSMLEEELSGRAYSKADHNRRLQVRIGRSKGSIEFKHQNISAVLINFRQPFIPGYLPRQELSRAPRAGRARVVGRSRRPIPRPCGWPSAGAQRAAGLADGSFIQ